MKGKKRKEKSIECRSEADSCGFLHVGCSHNTFHFPVYVLQARSFANTIHDWWCTPFPLLCWPAFQIIWKTTCTTRENEISDLAAISQPSELSTAAYTPVETKKKLCSASVDVCWQPKCSLPSYSSAQNTLPACSSCCRDTYSRLMEVFSRPHWDIFIGSKTMPVTCWAGTQHSSQAFRRYRFYCAQQQRLIQTT